MGDATVSVLLTAMAPNPPPCPDVAGCLPGDVVVRKVRTGFLIGRAAAPGSGPGPWWHYIDTVPSFEEATRAAHGYAKRTGMRVWLHSSGLDYVPLAHPEAEPAAGRSDGPGLTFQS